MVDVYKRQVLRRAEQSHQIHALSSLLRKDSFLCNCRKTGHPIPRHCLSPVLSEGGNEIRVVIALFKTLIPNDLDLVLNVVSGSAYNQFAQGGLHLADGLDVYKRQIQRTRPGYGVNRHAQRQNSQYGHHNFAGLFHPILHA